MDPQQQALQAKLEALCATAGLELSYFSVQPYPGKPGWSKVSVSSNPNDYIVSTQRALDNFESMQTVICLVLAASQPDKV